jgi:hypothetical protein
LLAAAVWPTAALAEEGRDQSEAQDPRPAFEEHQAPAGKPIAADEKRPVPDYDRREDEPTSLGEAALWVPRVLLFPLYLVTEFVVRRPLGLLLTTAEKHEWFGKPNAGPPSQHGFVPSGLIDYGLRATGGVYFWADDPLLSGHRFRLRAVTGGAGYVNVVVKERIPFALNQQVSFRGEYDVRSDWVFYGLGPRSDPDPTRFRADRFDARIAYETRLWRSSSLVASLGIRDVRFNGEDVDAGDDPSIDEAIASGRLSEPPPGFGDGYTIVASAVRAAFDTRRRRYRDRLPPASDFVSPPGSGVRLAVRAEHASGLRSQDQEWIGCGGTLAGFVDLDQHQRVLGMILAADFVEPLGDEDVPFTELASLGGARPFRGFLQDRLLDRSAISLALDYQYPIWVWLDGAAHYAVGNVFGPALDGFDLELLRSSFGLGLRSTGSRDHVFELLVAFGTDTFEDGGEIESFRLVIGVTSGF